MTVRRRSVVLAGVSGLAAAGLAACPRGRARPSASLRIAAGEPGGFYRAFAELLGRALRESAGLQCRVIETTGSLANAELLRTAEADLALLLSDSAEAVRQGADPGRPSLDVRALGRVYENYLQVAVRAASPLRTVQELAGRVVSVGAAGSGASLTGERVLQAAGIDVTVRHLGLVDAAAALASGGLDALVWSGGVPTPALTTLDTRVGLRLLPLDELLPALRARYGALYDQIAVPAGVYQAPLDVGTVGVANLLLCRPDLPDDLASAVVHTLATRADRLVPAEALGTQFLELRTLVATGRIPLHPGAISQYRHLHG